MKRFFVAVLILACAVSGFGFDYGLNVDNAFLYASSGTAQIADTLKATVWTYVGQQAGTILNVRASYLGQFFGMVSEPIPPVKFPYMFDIDELSFAFSYPGGRVILGRYLLTEPTRAIFSHKVDGFSLRHSFGILTFGADVGYTGLLWKNASAVSPSLMDINYAQSDDVVLGSPRLLAVFLLRSALFQQEFRVGAIVQEDLRNRDGIIQEGETEKQPGMGGLLDTQYLFAQVTGPILPILYYTAYGVYGTGRSLSYTVDQYRYAEISSVLAGANAQLYLREIFFSLIQLGFRFATGDADATSFWESNTEGNLQTFISLTGAPSGLVFSPNPGNIILTEASYSMKPAAGASMDLLSTLQVMAKAFLFFRPTTGYISEAGIPGDAAGRYLGTEADVMVNSRPFSDLGFSVSGGVFFPSGVFVTEEGGKEPPRFSLRATVSLSM